MRKWAQAYADAGMGVEQVAALDVTDEPDGGLSVMADLKLAYTTTAKFEWHECYHDEGTACKTEWEI